MHKRKTIVRATNHMCVVIYEAAKSHLCTCILSGMRDSHIHTQRQTIYGHIVSYLCISIHRQDQSPIYDSLLSTTCTSSSHTLPRLLSRQHTRHTHTDVWRYSSTSYLRTYMPCHQNPSHTSHIAPRPTPLLSHLHLTPSPHHTRAFPKRPTTPGWFTEV